MHALSDECFFFAFLAASFHSYDFFLFNVYFLFEKLQKNQIERSEDEEKKIEEISKRIAKVCARRSCGLCQLFRQTK